MKSPAFLHSGDKVAIVSPAGKIDTELIRNGARILQERGFEVEVGIHASFQSGIFAGTDLQRASDLQKALDDKTIKAVFFARGGYGSIRVFHLLNWSAFFKNPKWLVGFSDITVFHNYLQRHGIPSVHGVMSAWFEQEGRLTPSFLQMMDLLEGKIMDYQIGSHPLNQRGRCHGILTGGNLSIIQSLRGTPLDIDPRNKILFIEDIGEHYYHVDRMLYNLYTGGFLKKLSGVLVGYFTDMKNGETPFGMEVAEMVRSLTSKYGYPVAYGFPSGHELPNLPLFLGKHVEMDVSDEQVLLKQR